MTSPNSPNSPTSSTSPGGPSAAAVRTGLILAVCCLGQFMFVLDVASVNVAVPVIAEALGFDMAGLHWLYNSYAIALCGFMMLGGRLADLYGQRRVFLAGGAIFTVAALAGGLAQGPASMVAARGLQGLGAAILVPVTLTVLGTTFTGGPRRTRAFGLWSGVAGGGAAVGVLVGGMITEWFSWRGTMLGTAALGVVLLVLVARAVPEQRNTDAVRQLDLLGVLSLTGGIVALVFGINEIEDHGWASARVVTGLTAAAALLALFLYDQARIARQPLVPLTVFRNRSVSAANLVAVCAWGALGTMFYFISMLFQAVLGYSPLETGAAYLPLALGIFTAARGVAGAVLRLGARPVLMTGLTLAALGMAWLSQAGPGTGYASGLFGPLLLLGLGEGMVLTATTTAATAGLPGHLAGLGSGLLNTTRQLGGAVGLVTLVSIATGLTNEAAARGEEFPQALMAGFSPAFLFSAAFLTVGLLVALAVPGRESGRSVPVASGRPAPAREPAAPVPAEARPRV
ncbi:MFS transporter [Streptomyces xinghaiensis]|uniref:MFS transporter n=1 Tax=Streptomyces xinghaiensis TaxID=1038928 RepID=UPI00344779CE